MLSGPRLDPFSARLHAIHQKRRALNPQPQPQYQAHEEHDAQGFEDETQAVGERADTDEPALDLEPVEAVDTGCAECGGMGNKKSDPVEELRTEMTAIKERLAELEEAVAALEMP